MPYKFFKELLCYLFYKNWIPQEILKEMHSLQPFYIVQIYQMTSLHYGAIKGHVRPSQESMYHHSTALKLLSLVWKIQGDPAGSLWCSVSLPSWGRCLNNFPSPFLIHRTRAVMRMTMVAGDQLLWRKTVLNQKLWKLKHILRELNSTLKSQQNGDREGYIWPRTSIYSDK